MKNQNPVCRMIIRNSPQIFQVPFPYFKRETYNNSFQVSGTPGKHQWLQSSYSEEEFCFIDVL
ncbi:hypothetical protein MtrunA17_Chr8g0368451 [Medicago truncatula]|uniref:Uncharacterized protein n=1 Tax=Medicago truncatula TaxID=3880 RepID=A0A396GMA7_MEDTR|nr:hypothetical protein MtrunA17_Chr8g0368451 [Medicago truncatula]